MSEQEATHGLNCPQCGGIVPIPEGQVIVECPFCQLRSMVRGDRGLHRYQVPVKIDRKGASEALQRFLKGHRAIAGDVVRLARLEEAFIAYLPFWAAWARILGWVFGEKQVGSGDNKRYEPREVKLTQDMDWSGAACDVGEFGVESVPLTGRTFQPFNADVLHESGLVFEPVGSESDAREASNTTFNARVQQGANLDRVSQMFIRSIRRRMGVVYYPLWVMRYLYRGRSFQVVVDGFSGEVLYGKAPGSTLYRAAVLVGGMALGALLAVDASAVAFYLASQTKGDSGSFMLGAGVVALVGGFGLMGVAYRAFRYGEQYEFRARGKSALLGMVQAKELFSQVQEMTKWVDRLN